MATEMSDEQLDHKARYHAYIKYRSVFQLDPISNAIIVRAIVKLDECDQDIRVEIPISVELLDDIELIDEIMPEMIFSAARAFLESSLSISNNGPRTLPMHDNCPLSTL